MTQPRGKLGKRRFAPALLAAAGLAIAIPSTGLAVVNSDPASFAPTDLGFIPFTPANVDPALVRQVAATMGGEALRFTPAARPAARQRTVTMAVRVDEATARAISVRAAIESASGEARLGGDAKLAQTRYNLGIARGYQSFARPAPTAIELPAGIRDIAMPDLSSFRSEEGGDGKPSRFQPRIALEREGAIGRAPRTLEGAGDQTVEVGGAYRVTGNLNVTAGVRLSQDRDRLAPLTDGVEDSKAVYVGTQISF